MVSLVSILDIFALVSFIVILFSFRDHQRRQGVPYPPGPRPLPLVGNFLDIPKELPWLTYTEWGKVYGKEFTHRYQGVPLTGPSVGDVFCIRIFGQLIVILNSPKVIKDLLEKRGEIYSDRFSIPFFEM